MVTRRFGEASHAKVVSPRCLAEYFKLVSARGSCQRRCLWTSLGSIIQRSHEANSKRRKRMEWTGRPREGLKRDRRGMHEKQYALSSHTNLHQRYVYIHSAAGESPFFDRAAAYQQGYLTMNKGRDSSRLGR